MASMWPLLATFIAQYDTPWHHHTSHHITAHDITTKERLKAGWHKKLWRTQCDTSTPKLKWPVWHYHAQIEVLASTLELAIKQKHWVWMINMFEFVMACLSACRVWKISSSGNFECWQSCRRFLGSWKQPWSGLACPGHAVGKDVSGDTLYKTGFHELYLHTRFPRRSWCFSGDHQLD